MHTSIALTILDILPASGTERNTVNVTIDKTGGYVVFLSNSDGMVSGITTAAADGNGAPFYRGYARNLSSTANTYTLVTTGTATAPSFACNNLAISGDGNYVVFDTKSKNLTSDSYTEGKIDVFYRKWK
jgi:hypothetical protein